MERYDGVIILGAQVGVNKEGKIIPATHTEMRTRAAGIAYQQNVTQRFIVSGGYNFGVRYDLDLSVPIFGTQASDRKPDFSDEARMKARWYRSEASVMAELLKTEYDIPPEILILEEDSKTTKENAQYCKVIAERCGWKKIGLLTLLYHMGKALKEFQEAGLQIEPLFAEDLLMLESRVKWVSQIYKYYSIPKGGKQWDVEKIRELLDSGKSIGELMEEKRKIFKEGGERVETALSTRIYWKHRYYGLLSSGYGDEYWEEGELPKCCKDIYEDSVCRCGEHFGVEDGTDNYDIIVTRR